MEREQYRYAAISFKEQALKLPPVDMKRIEWSKDKDNSPHFTTRSLACQKQREQMQKKYKNSDTIIIENDEWTKYDYDEEELQIFQSFVDENVVSNTNCLIRRNDAWMSQSEVLGIRNVANAPKTLQKILKNQKECYAKVDLDAGTVIGQYIGNEILENEWYELFNGTNTEKEHMIYRFGTPISGSQYMEIDAYSVYKHQMDKDDDKSFLLRLNDGRVNIFDPATKNDKKRINCRFVSVLANGWPMVLVQTTKKVKAGKALWIDYGPNYKGVLDEIHTIDDQKNKMAAHSNLILNNIDLKADEPFNLDLISGTVCDNIEIFNVTNQIKAKTTNSDKQSTKIINKKQRENKSQPIKKEKTKIRNQCNDLNGSISIIVLSDSEDEDASTETIGDELPLHRISDPTQNKIVQSGLKRKSPSDSVEDNSTMPPIKKQKRNIHNNKGEGINHPLPIIGSSESKEDECSNGEYECWLGGIRRAQTPIYSVQIRYIPPQTNKQKFIRELEQKYAIKILNCTDLQMDKEYSPYLIAQRVEVQTKEMKNRLLTSSDEKKLNFLNCKLVAVPLSTKH